MRYLVEYGIELFHSCIESTISFFSLWTLFYPVSLCLFSFFLTGRFKRHKTTLELGEPGPNRKNVKENERQVLHFMGPGWLKQTKYASNTKGRWEECKRIEKKTPLNTFNWLLYGFGFILWGLWTRRFRCKRKRLIRFGRHHYQKRYFSVS